MTKSRRTRYSGLATRQRQCDYFLHIIFTTYQSRTIDVSRMKVHQGSIGYQPFLKNQYLSTDFIEWQMAMALCKIIMTKK